MTEVEEYFPRGGKKPVAAKYFKQNINFLGKPENASKKKRKPIKNLKKASEGDDGYLSDVVDNDQRESVRRCATSIHLKTIKPGLNVLCRVCQTSETKVYVSLPSMIPGSVMACHISEAYNKVLEAYVNDEVRNICELRQMFRPGQYVACQVLEVDKENIMLSMMPQHINGFKSVSDLIKGTIIQAAVLSVEDHGYLMDIGMPGCRAFLPKNNVDKDSQLEVGMVIWCAVSSADAAAAVVTLSSNLASLQKTILKRSRANALLPGSAVLFTVDQPLVNGIEGHILDNITSYIKRNHTDKVKGKKPTLGQKVRAHVLYVMPTSNIPMLTMRDIFDPKVYDLKEEQKFQEGHIIEDAKVIAVYRKHVIFRLGPGSTGIMAPDVGVHMEKSDEQVLAKAYPIGSTRKIRIIRYNPSDHIYTISDSHRTINEKYYTLRDVSVGDLVPGVVKSVTDTIVKVNVGKLKGLIPHAHMTDAGYCIDKTVPAVSKLPRKKFQLNKRVPLRVWVIDHDKNNLVLTAKSSLLNPDLVVLKEYEEAVVGEIYTGVIKFIRPHYILVDFFNQVTAYVPKNLITEDHSVDLVAAYHIGQIVNCTIAKVDPEAKKMVGRLTKVPKDLKKKAEKRKQSDLEDTEVPNKKKKSDESDNNKKKHSKTEDSEQDAGKVKKLNKKQKEDNSEAELLNDRKNKKDKKKNKEAVEKEQSIEEPTKAKKQKKKKIVDKPSSESETKKFSEESDDIDTDIYDDSDNILNPQEMGLVDLTDCEKISDYKKRKLSIAKSIAAKERRIKKIDNKIAHIEEKGLSPKNKHFHSAMHSEKLVLEKRQEKLNEALLLTNVKIEELKQKEIQERKEAKAKRKAKKISDINSKSAETEVPVKESKKRKREEEKEKKKEIKKEKAEKRKEKKEKVKETENVLINSDVIKVVDSLEPVLDVPSVKDFWSAPDIVANKNVQEDDSSSSEDEDKDQPKKKRKKLSVAEKLAKARAEEDRVRELERKAIESESQPRSCEQFERALLANPDSSELWIAYMAFHLQATEIEKARAVGRKALKTISFREEQEKLNVWLALLNVEIRFGTKETQQKTLEDALQANEPYSIHSKLLEIYMETGSHQELSSLADRMMRKYKRNPDAYVACGKACFKAGLCDKGRQVMQKAIAVLEKKEHVSVLVQFALLERSHGSGDRAEAIFEQITAVYPKRVDVCTAYVDMLLKTKDVERVRQVMERQTSLKLPARKMKALYTKWIAVEEQFGNKENVEKIRQRALEYIEKAKF